LSETPEEIIATAMLLGCEFANSGAAGSRCGYGAPGRWAYCGSKANAPGWYLHKHDAAISFLHSKGFHLDFNGDIVPI